MLANSATRLPASSACRLGQLKKGEYATIAELSDGNGQHDSALGLRLRELGFVPGEKIRVVAHAFPWGDPIAVRLGNTTFALRREEASMIYVVRLPESSAQEVLHAITP